MDEPSVIHLHTFGELSLEYDNRVLDFSFDHPYKLWLLILFFVYHRNDDIRAKDLIEFIWRDTEKSRNPLNALKALLFRLRNKLEELAPGRGHDWIVFSNGCYRWTPGVETRCDYDDFDRFLAAAKQAADDNERISMLLSAARLYDGEFAQRLSYDPWVADITAQYREQYQSITATLPALLEQTEQYDDLIRFCMASLEFDPYNETLAVHIIRALGITNRHLEAISVYESMAARLLADVGVIPSEELRNAYRDARTKIPNACLSFDELYTGLTEQADSRGPIFCDYDYFRTLYRLEARHIKRSGGACTVCLFTVESKTTAVLSPRSLTVAYRNLREVLSSALRAGDVVSVGSNCQYIVLLPDAAYNSSITVCMRIVQRFVRQFPHSPAVIRFEVRNVEPYMPKDSPSEQP